MTAYLLTEAQHAQIVDALEWPTPGTSAQVQRNLALAMLKAMKPQTPVAYLVYDPGACSQDLYFEEELGDMDGNSVESLYALGDTA